MPETNVAAETACRAAALSYAGQGFKVLALWWAEADGRCGCGKKSCQSSGKHPIARLMPSGVKDATNDPQIVADWWRRYPPANVGIATGSASGLVAVDIDADRGGFHSYDELCSEHEIPPDTAQTKTGGGGRHVFFKAPERQIGNRGNFRPGIDFKAESGYVVAAPSNHRSGGQYEVDIPLAELAPLPKWLEVVLRENEGGNSIVPLAAFDLPDWDGRTPESVEALVRENTRVRRLFNRDRRTRAGGGDPSACDFALASALYEGGIEDPRDIAIGVMASRHRDPEAWAKVAGKAKDYFERTVRAAIRKSDERRTEIQATTAATHEALRNIEFPWNEKGNTDRFLAIHGADLKYHEEAKRWLAWDGRQFADGYSDSNARGGAIGFELRAQQFLDDLWELPKWIDDEDTKVAAEKWVRRSGTASMLKSIQALARSRCAVSEAELDSDPYLLNVRNGVVDLRTMELLPHDRKHLCTRIAGAPFDPSAIFDDWDSFIRAALPDMEVRVYFQKCMGYSLLGIQPEQVFFFIHGPGATGKSTAMKAIAAACGTYHRSADFATFLDNRMTSGGAGPTPDVARLARVRIVSSTEVGHGRALNDGLIKQLSGGDTVTARALHAEHQEWSPVMGLWLVANDRPKGRVDDDALWRRLRPFEFDQRVAEGQTDSTLGARLDTLEARTAVLAWMLRGVEHYIADGHLDPPARVQAGVDSYRESSNPLSEFLAECTVRDPKKNVRRSDLWEAYKQNCHSNEARPIKKKEFSRIVASDYPLNSTGAYEFFEGIDLNAKGVPRVEQWPVQ